MQTEEVLKKGPLEGITVLDFSRVLAGPYCTMILADLGARVIKIGRFGTGDDTRAFGPFVDGESAYFMCFNRGKESIVLDIKSPRDRELLERLLDRADVVVENFRPGVMDRLGYGAERLAKTHPHIVYASISGFGHTGPFSDLPGYDMVVQAMGGVMIAAGNDTLFMLMADALGSPELALDPRFMSNDLRCSNRPTMVTAIETLTKREPVEYWIAKLNEAGVPCSPINTIDKLFDHP